MNLINELVKNPFVLAPMAGITDKAFRGFMRQMNCGPVITELVSAKGLQYNSEKTLKLMQFDSYQHPVGVQIFGEDLQTLSEAAKFIEGMGADFVDLNFGCPVPKVVKKGSGSAVLKDLSKLKKILRATKSAVSIPVTIKVRTGWDAQTRNTEQVAQIAYDEGISWVAIHGRTRAQGYSGQSDWDYIRRVKSEARLPILGNGDITTPQLAIKRLEESGCDGVMIGRGCLKNPWIFREALNLYLKKNHNVHHDFKGLFQDLYEKMASFHDERIAGLQIKKLSSWFSAGYPGAANYRRELFKIKEHDELMGYITNYFSNISNQPQKDTSSESFLMGGHG